ncbi:methyltransferase domain-containing protein [Neohortaea acidophila]|uniref:Methyltransferase domain-containing protein n=1 Tax=Neohortaea acidophila TaxID=245834 RepID=A0A6A6PPT3_9PEZI|nr:methyltransferase domain-containing protein [Neohortaea acidophila]KAF2482032.1 methyltransferase domain-containing protein [Neohortaea acidophila]
MLPTPSTSHVNYDQVYEPAEDSYLLLDTLSSASETAFLQRRFPQHATSPLVVEIGPGSGVVLAFVTAHAGRIFARRNVGTLGVDVNPVACAATRQTVQTASASARADCGVFLDAVNGDLTTAIKPGSVDVLIFNPPYVPSESLPSLPVHDEHDAADARGSFARDSHLLSLSTDGGIDGMEITNRLLAQLDVALSARGVAYILLCAQNKPEIVMAQVRAWPTRDASMLRWNVEKVASSGRKAGWEKLCVIRIWSDR